MIKILKNTHLVLAEKNYTIATSEDCSLISVKNYLNDATVIACIY